MRRFFNKDNVVIVSLSITAMILLLLVLKNGNELTRQYDELVNKSDVIKEKEQEIANLKEVNAQLAIEYAKKNLEWEELNAFVMLHINSEKEREIKEHSVQQDYNMNLVNNHGVENSNEHNELQIDKVAEVENSYDEKNHVVQSDNTEEESEVIEEPALMINHKSSINNIVEGQVPASGLEVATHDEMVVEAIEYFEKLGHKLSADYSFSVGTNLNSGIELLEDNRIIMFGIENYDFDTNNIFYYYIPEYDAGYRYDGSNWTEL